MSPPTWRGQEPASRDWLVRSLAWGWAMWAPEEAGNGRQNAALPW